MLRILLFATFFALILARPAAAQAPDEPAEPGPIGLAASLQAGQLDILMPVRISPRVALVPALGFTLTQDLGTDLRVGLAARQYLRDGRFQSYVGGRAGLFVLFPSERDFGPTPDTMTDFLLGVLAGGEAFVMPFLSFGVEAQLNAVFSHDDSHRFGNPGGIVLGTGAAVIATVYF